MIGAYLPGLRHFWRWPNLRADLLEHSPAIERDRQPNRASQPQANVVAHMYRKFAAEPGVADFHRRTMEHRAYDDCTSRVFVRRLGGVREDGKRGLRLTDAIAAFNHHQEPSWAELGPFQRHRLSPGLLMEPLGRSRHRECEDHEGAEAENGKETSATAAYRRSNGSNLRPTHDVTLARTAATRNFLYGGRPPRNGCVRIDVFLARSHMSLLGPNCDLTTQNSIRTSAPELDEHQRVTMCGARLRRGRDR
jgi:hypothetical protein